MVVIVDTAPSALVTLAQVKQQLNVLHNDDDALLELLIDTVSQKLDGPKGILGQSVGEQTLVLKTDAFPCEPLPCGPILSVTSIGYLDSAGDAQTLTETTDWVLRADGTVTPVASWPGLDDDPEAVTITYVAGQESVPAPIKWAALLMAGYLYLNREASADDAIGAGAVRSLLINYADLPI